jgi:tetratricopeptide (TPR) repeat protein
LSLASCSAPWLTPGPTPTPTPLIAPYNAAVATAQAGADAMARAQAHYERGNFYLDNGAYEQAIADYDQAIADYSQVITQTTALTTTLARTFNNRGLAHVYLNQLDQALIDYGEAIKNDPTYTRAYRNRLIILEQLGDTKAIAETYAQLAAIDPVTRADYLYGQGSALQRLRDVAGARSAYDAALAANPQQVDALYERSLLNFAEGKLDAARADLDAALAISPRALNAHYARALVHSAQSNHLAAINDFNVVLRDNPQNAEALLGRATAYHAAGDAAKARADLDALEVMELDETLQVGVAALRERVGS